MQNGACLADCARWPIETRSGVLSRHPENSRFCSKPHRTAIKLSNVFLVTHIYFTCTTPKTDKKHDSTEIKLCKKTNFHEISKEVIRQIFPSVTASFSIFILFIFILWLWISLVWKLVNGNFGNKVKNPS